MHDLLFLSIYYFLTDEIMAVLKLDNTTMGQTNWKPCSQQAWDQRYGKNIIVYNGNNPIRVKSKYLMSILETNDSLIKIYDF